MSTPKASRLVQSIPLHTTVPVVAWAFLSVLAEHSAQELGLASSDANALIARLLKGMAETLSPGLWNRAVARDAVFVGVRKKTLPPGQEVTPIERGAELVEWIKAELAGGGR